MRAERNPVAAGDGDRHARLVIGHPTVRAWYSRHRANPGRARLTDSAVQGLLAQIAPRSPVTDLGGEDSLNLQLDDLQVVLRVYKPPTTRAMLLDGHELRRALLAHGLLVPAPVAWHGRSILRCGSRWAELEQYLPLVWPTVGVATNRWLFTAIGHLHRVLKCVAAPRHPPLVRSWASPDTLHRWLQLNVAAGVESVQDPIVGAELETLIRRLRRVWLPATRLPNQLIHGDLHPGNVMHSGASTSPVYLDLMGVTRGPRIQDLAYALADLALGPSDPAPGTVTFDWSQLPTLLSDYEAAAGWPLSTIEREALSAYTAAVPLYQDVCDWSERPGRHLTTTLLNHPEMTTLTPQEPAGSSAIEIPRRPGRI